MKQNKKALILLNMGGARSKDELKMFLTNMFNDKNILTIKNPYIRKALAWLIVSRRLDKAWENYKLIGNTSPIYEFTDKLLEKCSKNIEDFKTYKVMRYTPPFSKQIVEELKKEGIKSLVLLPLYPQYSTTTTKSSLEDFMFYAKDSFEIKTIYDFYRNEKFNDAIIKELFININDEEEYNLIFSAHGLPQDLVDKGDPYEKQMKEHILLLSNKLKELGKNFKSINLAYQSKVGPLKWLEPSLEDMLKNFKDEKVLIYPLSFIIDNSETFFELDIEYRHFAKDFGISDYRVCKCMNDNDDFIEVIKDLVL